MIDFVEETPPLRRQRVEHFRRKIGFLVPDIDVIITEKELGIKTKKSKKVL